MRIQAVNQFDVTEMYTDLLTIGCYVFHDPVLENICHDVDWVEIQPDLFYSSTTHEVDILKERVQHHVQDFFKLNFVSGGMCRGVDGYVYNWHNDENEKIDIQFLCYQCTLDLEDGGTLEMQCFDGITRSYSPRMGDVMVMNHRNLLIHRVTPLKKGRTRMSCTASYKYIE